MRLAFVLLFVTAALAANVVLKEPTALEGPWRETGVAMDKNHQIAVTIQLKRTGQEALAQEVIDRATPGSPRFREWLSFEEAQSALKADPRGIALVEKWLRASGLSFTSTPLKDQFQLKINVAQAEQLFETFFHRVENPITGQTWHRASTLHVPAEVAPHIAAVFGLHGLPLPLKSNTVSVKSPDVIVNVGPKELNSIYQVSGRGRKSKAVRQAVAEFQGEFMAQEDLTTFFKQLVPNAQSGDELVYAYLGNNGTGYGIEALLDIEYIMGLAPGILTEFWAWRNWDFCSDLVNWTTLLLNTKDIPLVHSISYGWQGPLSQLGCVDAEIKTIDDNMMTLAGRGTTLIFASGDSGSGYDGTKLWPIWPGSSSWVTAVGSTCFTDNTMKVQMATTQFGSGSGFSPMFDQGPWQKRAVSQYLSTAKDLPPATMYPKAGRATADVSALGEGYKVYVHGSIMIVGGTSASAPAFAAMISLVNDKLDSEGKKPLGFLNPWIYNNTDMWADITQGSNKISRGGTPLQYGFECQAGWDPATGLGVPIFPQLIKKA